MAYIFSKKFTVTQRYEAEALIHNAIMSDWSRDKFQREAKKVNLSYRRQNMFHDFRRAQSMEKAKSAGAKERAVRYFEELYEPHRAKMGWTSSQETEWRRTGKMGLLEDYEDQEEYEEEWEKYDKLQRMFGL